MPRTFDDDVKSKSFSFSTGNTERKANIETNKSKSNVVTKLPTGNVTTSQPVWSNTSIKVHKSFTIVIPHKIELLLLALNQEYADVEYTILTKTTWNSESKQFVMAEEYFIPQQQVTSVHIDYDEDNVNFNTVIHKHPDGCMNFSGTDEEYINTNFDFSVLWVNRTFHIGYAKIKCSQYSDDCFVRVPLEIKRGSMALYLPEDAKDKIKKKSYSSWQRTGGQNGRGYISGDVYKPVGNQHFGRDKYDNTRLSGRGIIDSKGKDNSKERIPVFENKSVPNPFEPFFEGLGYHEMFNNEFDRYLGDEYTDFFIRDREEPKNKPTYGESLEHYRHILADDEETKRLAEACGVSISTKED